MQIQPPPGPFRLLLVEDNIGRVEELRSWLPPWAKLVWAQSAGGALGLIRRDPGRVYGGILLDHDLGERAMTRDDELLSGTDVAIAIIEHFSTDIPVLIRTSKQMTADLAEQIHETIGLQVPERLIPPRFRAAAAVTGTIAFRHIRRTLAREPVADQVALILKSLERRTDVVLFIDALEVPPTQAEILADLSEHCHLCAALDAENRRARIQRLLWKFQMTLELKPLVTAETRSWVEQWLERNPIVFESPRIRNAYVRAVARDSGGIPAAVQGLLDLTLVERSVTRRTIRTLSHEAALTYLDMTPVLVILSVGFMAMRYISRGMGMQELMVMAGVGTSMFYLLLYFGRMMQARRR
jgi:CheY-like chemotaxis protein